MSSTIADLIEYLRQYPETARINYIHILFGLSNEVEFGTKIDDNDNTAADEPE